MDAMPEFALHLYHEETRLIEEKPRPTAWSWASNRIGRQLTVCTWQTFQIILV